MKQYNVTGMSCAACSARVEKAVSAVEGVSSCSVNLLTNSMNVEGTASPQSVINAVTAAGYGASVKGAQAKNDSVFSGDNELRQMINRLAASAVFLIILMYFSMGHAMWGWRIPAFFEGNPAANGLVQLLLTVIIMVINQKFFISGFKGLVHRAPNMDTLVALGSSAAFIYSAYALFAVTDAQAKGDIQSAMSYLHEFYFESAAMILTLITVGKTLEAYSKGKTTDALKGLIDLAPKTANVIRNGEEVTVPADELHAGDVFVVRPGESIPADGIVLEGESAVDESALTGESIPVDKSAGSTVSAASINRSGFIKCETTRAGQDTVLSMIIKTVSDAAASKAPIAKVADKVSGIFVPTVMSISAVTAAVWLILGQTPGFALARAISVLVISCPCALGLATPVAVMVGSGVGAKNGILFKTAAALEAAGRIDIAALDKTGTITTGKPTVTDIIPHEGISEDELLKAAYSLEIKSEHPLAKAVVSAAEEKGMTPYVTDNFSSLTGNGVAADIDGITYMGGSMKFIGSKIKLPSDVTNTADSLSSQGKTPLIFIGGEKILGIIAAADVIREDSAAAVRELHNMGIHVVMLTGDNERTAAEIGRQAGVDEVIAGVLPDGKESVIRSLMKKGRVAMAGDGINDAPALTRADIGIAIGAGTDIAIDAADIVLMKSRLSDVPAALKLGRSVLRNIHQNLFWAFFYNCMGIPLAAGAFIGLFGWKLDPMFGAAAMGLSSFCVVSNALRLNFYDIYKPCPMKKSGKKIKSTAEKAQEEKNMIRTINIEGMMCGHCEAAVKKALEAVNGVQSAEVSHEKGTATVTLSADVSDDVLKKAVEDKDYTVTSIE